MLRTIHYCSFDPKCIRLSISELYFRNSKGQNCSKAKGYLNNLDNHFNIVEFSGLPVP